MSAGAAIQLEQVRALVQQLQAVAVGSGVGDPMLIAEFVAQYAELVTAVNQRAEQCYNLLRNGFLVEAVSECEAPPALLELAAKLDFPERRALDMVCTNLGLSVPPIIRSDLVTDLSRGYQLLQSTGELLRKQRLLALADAPLEARLLLLNQLVQAAPDMVAWREDLMRWETQRLEDLERAVRDASRRYTLEELQELQSQIQSYPWHVPVPESLMSRLKKLTADAARGYALQYLECLRAELYGAYQRQDIAAVQTALQQYQHYLSMVRPDEASQYWLPIAPIASWAAEQQRRAEWDRLKEQRQLRLETLLNDGASWEAVNAAYQALIEVCPNVPALLENRYRARLRRHQKEQTTVIVLAVLGVLGIIGLMLLIRNA